jgi:hypothetical protein
VVDFVDSDPQETAEWRDAFMALLAARPHKRRMRETHGHPGPVRREPSSQLAACAENALRQHHSLATNGFTGDAAWPAMRR